MLEPTQIGVKLVARDESRSDPARDSLQFVVTDQRANVILGAVEFGRNLTDCQGRWPLHDRSITVGNVNRRCRTRGIGSK